MLVDSHCHLDFPEFSDELDQVVARAGEAGVLHILTICTQVTKFQRVREVAGQFDNMWCSVGIHPHNVENEPKTSVDELVALANDPKVVAFGETGLDFHYENSPRLQQERSFRAHINASRRLGLPVIVHNRNADDEMVRVLHDEYARGPFSGVIHCFTGGPEMAAAVQELDLYISISGIVTFKTAEELRNIVKTVPLDRLLVETDSPYLAPVPKRGKRNEPAFTAYTAAKVAELKGVTKEELAACTTRNFFSLFKKAIPTISDFSS